MNTSARNTALTAAAILVLLGGSASAFANTPTQQLNLSVPFGYGGVTNLGSQTYTIGGGSVLGATVNGLQVNNPKLQYFLVATVSGTTTSGYGTIRLTGTTSAGQVSATGTFTINADSPVATIGSDLPSAFISYAPNISITTRTGSESLSQPFAIESPYLNPFGNPIILSSLDGYTLSIVATYSIGTIVWQGTQVQGALAGTYGTESVSGIVTDTGSEVEDLVAGTAYDHGTTSFSQMTDPALDVTGTYTGSDTIPTAGATDCSSMTGIPGTCTETGFQSSGTWSAGSLHGTYATTWGVPALYFGSTITSTSSASFGNHGGFVSGFFGLLAFFHHL